MKKIFLLDAYNDFYKKKKEIYGAQKSMEQLLTVLKKYNECRCIFFSSDIEKDIFYKNEFVLKINKVLNQFGGKILKYNFFQKVNFIINYLFFQIKLIKVLKKEKPDLFYLNDPRSFFMIFLAVKILKIRTITYIRADIRNNFVNKLCIRYSNKIILIANNLLNELGENFVNKYKNKIKVIYTGFDFDEYNYSDKLLEIKNPKIKLGYVASINPRKGLDFLVEILKEKEIKENIILIISGGIIKGYEEYWNKIKEQLENNDIEYLFLDFQKDIHKVYNCLDILVLPSLSEGLPRSIIEAMAHRIPVIANNVGGVDQIIINEKNGFLENKSDKEKWISDLKTVISNNELRKEMGKSAEKIVREKFSLESFEKEILNEFE